MLQGLDVHHAALCLAGGVDRGHLELVGILLEKLVGHVGNLALGARGLRGVLDSKGDDHLVLPEGDGVDHRRLDFLGHHGVRRLDHANLRRRLEGHLTGELEVVDALLEAVALLRQVACCLRVLGKAGLGRLGLEPR